MDNIFVQLAIILGFASLLGFVTQKFKLPLLIAYLLGGLIIALIGFFDVKTSRALSFLPEIGVAFVLFLVGMELDLREIKSLGKPVIVCGILQTIITTLAGFIIAQFFGFKLIESWYLGLGLSFSSTIVGIKLLSDKKELTSLYGKLSIGILLLQDLIAVLVLLGLTATPSVLNLGLQHSFPLLATLFKAAIFFLGSIILSRYFLPQLFKSISDSSELLFLTALSFLFFYVSVSILLGFSVVIGAFLAGIALASSPYHYQIQGKVKPLRDFFVSLFFVYLGTQVNVSDIGVSLLPILAFTTYAVFIKPLIFLLILGGFGFRKHTMFQTGLIQSQISEFSLITALIGFRAGFISSPVLTLIASSLLLSTLISALLITHSGKLFKYLKSTVGFFERKNYCHRMEDIEQARELKDHIVVIGGHRVGGEIIKFLKRERVPQIVLDFNPAQVENLLLEKVPVVYGDMGDPEIMDALNLEAAKMVISTAPNLSDNKLLLEELKAKYINVPVIVRSESVKDARMLYKAGADLVIIPEIVAGDFLTEKLKSHLEDGQYFNDRPRIEMERLSHKNLAWE